MSTEVASLKIKVDTSDTVKAKNDLNNLSSVAKSTENQTDKLTSVNNLLNNSFSKSTIAIGAVASGFSLLVKKGIEYSATMEKLTNGLTTLNVMTSSNIDSTGKALSIEEKYTIARQESIEVMRELNKINLETPHSLDETVQIYKSMYTSMKTVNVTTEQMLDLTKKLSIAAGSSGIEFQQLLSGIDGLATGTVEVSSELGRFLKSIGLSNEELKKSSNIYDTINNKLKDVRGIQGYEEAVSNLSNSFDQLTGALVAPFFEDIKKGINGLASLFNELTTSVSLFYDKFKSIGELTSKDQLSKRAGEVAARITEIQEDLKDPSFFQSTGKLNAELRAANLELLSIADQFEKVGQKENIKLTTKKDLKGFSDELQGVLDKSVLIENKYKKLEDELKASNKATDADFIKLKEAKNAELKSLNDKANKEQIDAQKDKQKELERLEKEHQENIRKVTQDAKDMITSDVQKLADEYVKMYEVVKDSFSAEEMNALNTVYQKKAEDLTGVTELLKQAQEIVTSEIDKVNDKYMKMYDVIKDNPMFSTEDMQIFFEKWNKELDDLKPKLDYSKSIKLDTEGDNRAVAKITKGFDELNDATKQYQANRAKATKGSKEEAENEEQFRKDQINGYANISSAMADMFEKGSKEAAAFQAASTALALVEATRAILTQGTGDPYTAIPRMVAMAAMVGSLMKNIGVAFGMNKTTTSISSDSASSQIANTGTGTSLGDKAKQSESITKSLEILEDFAKPQYRITQQMAASLQSIDQKMGGVSALIVRTGGFAFGEGFTPSSTDTGWKNKVSQPEISAISTGSTVVSGALGGGLMLQGALATTGVGLAVGIADKLLLDGAISKTIDKAIAPIIGGLFGKTSTTVSSKLTDSGIYFADQLLGDAIDEIYGSAYQTIQKKTTTTKKSWFGSSTSTKKKSTTYFEDMSGFTETERQFSLVLKSIYDSVSLAGEALGESSDKIDSQLNSFVVSIGKISLKGLTGTQIQDTLTAIFGRIGDQLAGATFPALVEFQAVGEGLFTTLTRVASGIEEANYYTDRLGKSFEKISYIDIVNKQGNVGFEALYQSIVKADEALYGVDNNLIQLVNTLSGTAEELYNTYRGLDLLRTSIKFMGVEANALGFASIKGAGGIEELANGVNSYLENFLTDTEQLAFQTQLMSAEFAKLGLAMPTSKEGFTNLIKSLDVSSESGQELYGRLIILSDSFAKLFENTSSSKTSLLESISSFVKDLLGTTVTASSGTTFKTFADSFNNMIDAIAKGSSDLESIGQTTLSTAQAYIDTVTRTASTSAEVQFAKKVVANKLSSVVNAPDITLGTINDTLKISFNENSAIVNELKQMRTQLEYLNGLNTTQTATQIKTLSATRALIS